MKFRSRRQLDSAEGDMTPMIDMTFQLIAFFMVVINFSEVEQDERVTLPASELAQPPDEAYEQPLTIQLTKDETVLFGGQELTTESLGVSLAREARILREFDNIDDLSTVTVIIRADRSAKTGLVQEIIQECQDAEFDNFALRGRQSDETTLIGP